MGDPYLHEVAPVEPPTERRDPTPDDDCPHCHGLGYVTAGNLSWPCKHPDHEPDYDDRDE